MNQAAKSEVDPGLKGSADAYRAMLLSGVQSEPLSRKPISKEDLDAATLKLAEENHESWRAAKAAHGWKYGPESDKDKKTNPYLVDFDKLPDEVRQSNIDAVSGIVSIMAKLGLGFCKKDDLLSSIAATIHDNWSLGKIKAGWSYGPDRDDAKKIHPDLLPFDLLTDEDKSYDIETARGILDGFWDMGYTTA
jgi:hypothetical protein